MRVSLAIALALTALLLTGCLAIGRDDIPFDRLEARFASPASRYADMPGGLRVHYRDQGDPAGPAIVMVHGFSANLDAWELWAARLQGFRVITLDLPGHGLTRAPAGYRGSLDGYADLTDDLAARLGVTRYVIVGNSMGGAVAWNLALRRPGRLRGLVLVDPAGWPGPGRRNGPPPFIAALLNNPVGRSVIRRADPALFAERGLRAAYVDQSLVTPALLDRYILLARAPGHRTILTSQNSRPARPITPQTLGEIRVPTLVMHGEADRLIPVADGRAFAAAIPGARLVTYQGVGHVPMEQVPDRSAADLLAFLSALPVEQGRQ